MFIAQQLNLGMENHMDKYSVMEYDSAMTRMTLTLQQRSS